jgi:type I site-specific restriction endonuclease
VLIYTFKINLKSLLGLGSHGWSASASVTNEAFARVKIDQLLRDTDWKLTDGRSVRFEYPLNDGGKADYALFDRQGRALAVLEAKSTSVNLSAGEAQGRRYADQLGVPFIFLSNGDEVWFCDVVAGCPFSHGRDRIQPGRPGPAQSRQGHPAQSPRYSDRSSDCRGWWA